MTSAKYGFMQAAMAGYGSGPAYNCPKAPDFEDPANDGAYTTRRTTPAFSGFDASSEAEAIRREVPFYQILRLGRA